MKNKVYLLDLDGTMYRGNKIQPYALEFLHALQEKKLPYMFLTNNSKRTRAQNVKHMEQLGFTNIHPADFFTSAMAAARYVKKHNEKRRAWYIGEDGLKEALIEQGFTLVTEAPDFVFVGLDQQADYAKYSQAVQFLVQGAALIGTNEDRLLAQPDGFAVGNGAIVHMLEYASSKKSPSIGKPHAPILEECLQVLKKTKDEVLLIGDNLETDIQLGAAHGVETILVEGGVHTRMDCEHLGIYPDHIVSDLHELLVKL